MLNLGNPELAFRAAMLPNDGVGLARMEFIVSEHIGVHPMALVNPERDDLDPSAASYSSIGSQLRPPCDAGGRRCGTGVKLEDAASKAAE